MPESPTIAEVVAHAYAQRAACPFVAGGDYTSILDPDTGHVGDVAVRFDQGGIAVIEWR